MTLAFAGVMDVGVVFIRLLKFWDPPKFQLLKVSAKRFQGSGFRRSEVEYQVSIIKYQANICQRSNL
jgi:hypothetical protein